MKPLNISMELGFQRPDGTDAVLLLVSKAIDLMMTLETDYASFNFKWRDSSGYCRLGSHTFLRSEVAKDFYMQGPVGRSIILRQYALDLITAMKGTDQ